MNEGPDLLKQEGKNPEVQRQDQKTQRLEVSALDRISTRVERPVSALRDIIIKHEMLDPPSLVIFLLVLNYPT